MADRSAELNVMQIVLNLDRAGAQEVVRTLTQYLLVSGCRVTVCAFRDGPMRAEIEKLGAEVEIVRGPRYSVAFLPLFLAEMLRIRRQLARLIEIYHIDIVQTHILDVLDFLVLFLRRGTRLRAVLWTMHSARFLSGIKGRWAGAKKRVYRWLYCFLANWVDGFVAVSEEVGRSIIEHAGPLKEKVFVISNGVDASLFEGPGDKEKLCNQLGISGRSRLLATVGRLTEPKGHRYLIDAGQMLVSSYPDVHFLFIGDGELRSELRGHAQRAGLAANVHFLGVREDVPNLLVSTDLFVLPSLWEGLSIALLEAMAAGRPVVATAVSGTTQVVEPGKTGMLVPPRDGQALADAIDQLLSNPERAQAMGQAARQHIVRNFSAQKQALTHLSLYRQLLGQGHLWIV